MNKSKQRSAPIGPDLAFYEGPDSIEVDDEFSIELMWKNEGGAGRGLQLQAWGAAVAAGLVELSQATLMAGPFPDAKRVSVKLEQDAETAYVADWAEAQILPAALVPTNGPISATDLAAIGAAMITIRLHGRVHGEEPVVLLLGLVDDASEEFDILEITLVPSPSARGTP